MGPRAAAQDSALAEPRCVAGRPSPNCGTELLTNFGIYGITSTHSSGGHFRVAADWGPLIDVGRRSAVGATVFASLDADGILIGPAIRFRRKLASPGTSVEVSVGAPLESSDSRLLVSPYGMIKWSPARAYGFVLRPEWRRSREYDCSVGAPVTCPQVTHGTFTLSAGLELSGVTGMIATGATIVGVVALVLAYVSGDY
jgi:hypothetical protein